MPTAYSHLAASDVDTSSEEHRHECECRWLLVNKPTRTDKHMYLYGVPDRQRLMSPDPKTGREALAADYAARWINKRCIMKFRGLASADRLLADARRLHEMTTPRTSA